MPSPNGVLVTFVMGKDFTIHGQGIAFDVNDEF